MNNITENKWYTKKELAAEFGVDEKTIQRIVNEKITLDRPVHTQKGGYNNSQTLYDEEIHNMITAELAKHNTNQNTGVIQKQMIYSAKEQGILLNAVANSGDINAAKALCDLIMEKTQIAAENKQLQADNTRLRLENKHLREEAYNAYNEGFEEGRYRLNYMYRYDIY